MLFATMNVEGKMNAIASINGLNPLSIPTAETHDR